MSLRVLVLVLMVMALAAGCQPPRNVLTARALLDAPDRFYEQPIVIVGRVQSLRLRVPERGNSYTSFELADGTGRVPVMSGGTLEVDSGDPVEVRGVYRAVVRAGTDILRDTVEASFVRRLRAAGQVPGTPTGPP